MVESTFGDVTHKLEHEGIARFANPLDVHA